MPTVNSPTAEPALVAEELVKTYPGKRKQPAVHALTGLSVEVRAGTVLALLGPNGAGKSTTVKIFTTLSRADSGRARVLGADVVEQAEQVRRTIGLVSQKASSDPMATLRENLVLAGRIQAMTPAAARARADELLLRFRLDEAADRLAKTLSGGMARKLDVAIGLMHRPRVLFLDEPTTGLDPEARAELWAEIRRLTGDDGMTVLLTTHDLEEADQLADRVAIVDAGRIVVDGTPEALKRELRGDTLTVGLAGPEAARTAARLLGRVPGIAAVVVDGTTLHARADDGARAVPAVLALLDDAAVPVGSVTVGRPTLDDVYLRHVGHAYEGGAPEPTPAVAA